MRDHDWRELPPALSPSGSDWRCIRCGIRVSSLVRPWRRPDRQLMRRMKHADVPTPWSRIDCFLHMVRQVMES